MTLEELSKALGIDGEDEKDKFAILKSKARRQDRGEQI